MHACIFNGVILDALLEVHTSLTLLIEIHIAIFIHSAILLPYTSASTSLPIDSCVLMVSRIERLVVGWAVIAQWLEQWRLKPVTWVRFPVTPTFFHPLLTKPGY